MNNTDNYILQFANRLKELAELNPVYEQVFVDYYEHFQISVAYSPTNIRVGKDAAVQHILDFWNEKKSLAEWEERMEKEGKITKYPDNPEYKGDTFYLKAHEDAIKEGKAIKGEIG